MDGIENKVDENQATPEPVDLAQAFKAFNRANAAAAQDPVATEGSVDDSGGDGVGEPVAEDEANVAPASVGEDGAGIDGSADVIEPIDIDPARQRILREVQQRALQNVRKEFAEQQIEMWSIEDLYERDEQSGRVRFRNPDDPNRDFSSRYEAQQWIDSMNKQVTSSFRQKVNQEQQKLLRDEMPRLQVLSFADRYQQMDPVTRDIFEEMLAPYAIKNSRGEDIGFNVNLNAVAAQAERIASRFKQPANPDTGNAPDKDGDKQKPAPSGPALDIKTGASQAHKEPTTIGEALREYDRQQREAKKNGK